MAKKSTRHKTKRKTSSASSSARSATNNARRNKIEYAIIGGGAAGLYAAWRAVGGGSDSSQTDPRPSSIFVFELNDTVGGRLISLKPPGITSFRAEMGGMRFSHAQKCVSQLVKDLPLQPLPFITFNDDNIQYLRNVHFRRRDYETNRHLIPYTLRFHERGKKPEDLIREAIQKVIPDLHDSRHFGKDDWENLKFEGIPLYELGFWNVLSQVMSSDCYELVRDASGYDRAISNWNASDALPWYLSHFPTGGSHEAEYSESGEYSYIRGGYQELPNALCEQFVAMGGLVQTSFRLHKIEHKPGDFPFKLTFKVHTDNEGSRKQVRQAAARNGLEVSSTEDEYVVFAEKVILAMPRRSIEIVASGCPELQAVSGLITSVMPIPMFKIFFCYDSPWWDDAGVKVGQSTTTLPLRQCYYYGSEGIHRDGNSLLLASYEDGRNVEYWSALLRGDQERGNDVIYNVSTKGSLCPQSKAIRDRALSRQDSESAAQWKKHEAPLRLVIAAHRQIHEMHGLDATPMPYSAVCRDWTEDPYGGGVNYWKPGVRSSKIKADILQPIDGWDLFICGEAYSSHQGWVEGALETAEEVLVNRLGFNRYFPMSSSEL